MKLTFRLLLFMALALGAYRPSAAQFVTIPDAGFISAINNSPMASCLTGNQLDTVCVQNYLAANPFTNLVAQGYNIADLTGIQYFRGLYVLSIGNNQLTSLPPLPASLVSISCWNNQVTSLPPLPPGLTTLYMDQNPITTLPPLPPTLKFLSAYSSGLTSLPILPAALETLTVYYTYISVLPDLPAGLKHLNCHNLPLTCSPMLPNSLIFLDYGSTFIPCLPNHPISWTSGDINTLNLPICTPGSFCAPALPYMKGKAYIDYNNNCVMDGSDTPLHGRIVNANNQYYGITQTNGTYLMYLDTVTFSAIANLQSALWQFTCPGIPYTGTFTSISDSLVNADFPYYPQAICPWLWVDIGQNPPRACQTRNIWVNYCNNGSDSATNAYVEVTLDPEMTFVSSSIPFSSVSGSTYTFPVGTLQMGECGSFLITDSLSCFTHLDEAICIAAEIFPNNVCNLPNPGWDFSNVELRSACLGDTIRFGIYNTGTGNMATPSNYSIYEDHVLMINNASFQLPAGDSLIIQFPTTTKTYQLDAHQTPNHPGNSYPRVFVEACGPPVYSFGYITSVAQDDADDFVEIDCQQTRNSFDPNHKYVQPEGVTSNHYILANDELEYTITFQNTGNDTAYKVVVIDTIDTQVLDVATVMTGVSSHPYTFDVYTPGILRWTFNNINLLDSASHEPESHGFVKFKIRQQPNNPPGTVIDNNVGIYFDYNAPVITNTAEVVVQTYEYIFSVNYTDPQAQLKVTAFPNPFTDMVTLQVESSQQLDDLQLDIRDMTGRSIITKNHQGMLMQVNTTGLSSGVYMFTIRHQGRLLAAGKLVAR